MIEQFFGDTKKRTEVQAMALVDNAGEMQDIYVRSGIEGKKLARIVEQVFSLLAVSEKIDQPLDEAILVLEDVEVVVFNREKLFVVLLADGGEDISLLRLHLEASLTEMLTHRRMKRQLNKWPRHKSDYFSLQEAKGEDLELLQKFLGKGRAEKT